MLVRWLGGPPLFGCLFFHWSFVSLVFLHHSPHFALFGLVKYSVHDDTTASAKPAEARNCPVTTGCQSGSAAMAEGKKDKQKGEANRTCQTSNGLDLDGDVRVKGLEC